MDKVVKIVYCSDMHLELNPYKQIDMPDGDYLFLAGDITSAGVLQPHKTDANSRKAKARFVKFLETTKKFKHVYYVMGNHEHYDSIFTETKSTLAKFISQYSDNFTILDNDIASLDSDTLVLGCTFWTDFNNHNPIDMHACEFGMNDYRWIDRKDNIDLTYEERHSGKPIRSQNKITAEYIYQEHMMSKNFINKMCELNHDKKIILLTHHPLTYQGLNKQHSGNGLDPAFASNCDDIFHYHENISHAIFGHTHVVKEFAINNTMLYSNACGYSMEPMWKQFQYKVLEL